MNALSNRLPLRLRKPGLGLHRRVVRLDDVAIVREASFVVLVERLAVDGDRRPVDLAHRDQLGDDGGHPAGAVVLLAEVLARGLHVDEQRHVVADPLPVVVVELDADVARDRVQLDRRVRRAADRGVDDDRVLERRARQHVCDGFRVLPHHLDDALSGPVRHLLAVAVGRRNRGAPGQAHAERLGQRVHRRGRAHRVAMAGRGSGRGDQRR